MKRQPRRIGRCTALQQHHHSNVLTGNSTITVRLIITKGQPKKINLSIFCKRHFHVFWRAPVDEASPEG
eukprot:scaffold573172_cov23-Prasinocladus_malaysianus.AAC.1